MRIWKFPLAVVDSQAVPIPRGAQLIDVQMQRDVPCLWVLCDEKAPVEFRRIAIYGTGNPLPDQPGNYISTFQMNGGDLVFHAFDLGV